MPKFDLEKGSKFDIDKGITEVLVGLGWDVGTNFDLDACVFGLVNQGGSAKFYNDGSHAVFYGNKPLKQGDSSFMTADGSIHHMGDNRTGIGDGDDESVKINFGKLPPEINEISIFACIYEARKRGQDFGKVQNSYVRVVDQGNGQELCRYSLKNEFAGMHTVQVGSFVKEAAGWAFKAVGAGAQAEIGDVLSQYS